MTPAVLCFLRFSESFLSESLMHSSWRTLNNLGGHNHGETLRIVMDTLKGEHFHSIPDDVPMSDEARRALNNKLSNCGADYKDGSEILIDQGRLKKRPRKLTPHECENYRDSRKILL